LEDNEMHTSRTRILAAALLVAMASSVCNLPGGTPAPEAPAPGEIIIPPTTKVMDAEARAALTSVSADGTLTFSNTSPGLSELAPADVLVFEPTAAAPYGLLRKVRAVRTEGSNLIVETEGAEIREAVHQGQVGFVRELRAEDIRATQILQPGVQFQGATTARAPGPQAILGSNPLAPGPRLQGLTYSFDSDLGTNGQVRIRGNATLTPIMDVDLWISCNRKVLGICAEIPDLNFKTRVGMEESTSLFVNGNVASAFDRDVQIARHEFNPITLSIGPVPVVFVPILEVYLHGDGSLTATLDYSVQQQLTLVAGFKYNSDSGFEDLSERTANFTRTGPNFTGNLDLRGSIGLKFELLLYGVIGPYGSLEAGPHLSANLSGLPPDGNLLWRFEGCLWLSVGIDSVDVLDIHYSKELYRGCTGFGTGENRPPNVYITSPNGASQIYQGVPFALRGQAFDPDGGTATCRWTSSASGDPFPVNACEQSVTFPSQGSRSLTLTGTDPGGRTASTSITVNVQPPPTVLVTISNPNEGDAIGPNEVIALQGSASGGAGPYTFTWKAAHPTDSAGNGGTVYTIGSGNSLNWKPSDTLPVSGCEVSDFARLILEATDTNGFTGTRTISIRIELIC
jgi:hypothetical protein